MIPSVGLKSQAAVNNRPEARAIIPEEVVASKPNQPGTTRAPICPKKEETAAARQEITSMLDSFLVRRRAVAGGTMSIAITMILPTDSNAATVVTATMVMRR